jgi:DNA-directed RNA polymerase subunit RPC12/RpoP
MGGNSMSEKCWNCSNEFEPRIIKKEKHKAAFCPKCSTKHIYIEVDPGKLVISSAITNQEKTLRKPAVEEEKTEDAPNVVELEDVDELEDIEELIQAVDTEERVKPEEVKEAEEAEKPEE